MRTLGTLTLCFLLAACATMSNTAEQDYVWTCVDACKATLPPQCQVDSVDATGRYSVYCINTLANLDGFDRCMQQQYRDRPYGTWLKERAR